MALTRIRLWLRSFFNSERTSANRERERRIRPTLEWLEDRLTPTAVQFGAPTFGTSETAGFVDVTITLDSASTQQVSVNYATGDGTAKAGTDYTSTSGTLTIPAGTTQEFVSIPILDDNQSGETSPEAFQVSLSNPVNATLGNPSTTTVDIQEDSDSGNSAPVANNDSYSMTQDTVLSVPAPGVLANDTDPNNLPLTASLVSGPSYGQLWFNPDGSFVYQPNPGYVGNDGFAYQVSDGQQTSNVAFVNLVVAPAPKPLLVTQPTDDGRGTTKGTLSWAIAQANANAGSTITFNVPKNTTTNWPTIQVTAPLPVITAPVTIDGYSQAGGIKGIGKPQVELKGPGTGMDSPDANGLVSNSPGVIIQGLAIDDFKGDGVVLEGNTATEGNGDVVRGNYIGTDLSGTNSVVGNGGNGIRITSGTNNTIGGASGIAGNIISGNARDGITLITVAPSGDSTQNLVEQNTIGLDASGKVKLPNLGNGVSLVGATDNTIGGANDKADLGNVISGNGVDGVTINTLGSGNAVYGNTIGLGTDGLTALGNGGNGASIVGGGSANLIGAADGGSIGEYSYGNLISGNGADGVLLTAPSAPNDNSMSNVDGNLIGVANDGKTKVPNTQNGVEIDQVVGVTVYGDVISGNTLNGVQITGDTSKGAIVATQATVLHDYIGTDASGKVVVANNKNGVLIYLADQNTVGGPTVASSPVPSNVISGNGLCGINLGGSSNLIVNNYVGTDVSGTNSVPNQQAGVNIGWGGQGLLPPQGVVAANNTIGGTGGINSTLNLISGNKGIAGTNPEIGSGITLFGANVTGTVIAGDFIGVDITGLKALGNQNDGVYISSIAGAAQNTMIGGTGNNAGNVISANGQWGVDAVVLTSGSLQNNYVGYDVNGNNLNNGSGGENLPASGWESTERKPPQ